MIHRIDDDGAGPALLPDFPCADDRIDYRHEEAKRLARAGSGRDDITLPGPGFRDGLRLVAMKPERRFIEAEYPAGRFVEITRSDQIIDGLALKISRIQRQ